MRAMTRLVSIRAVLRSAQDYLVLEEARLHVYKRFQLLMTRHLMAEHRLDWQLEIYCQR